MRSSEVQTIEVESLFKKDVVTQETADFLVMLAGNEIKNNIFESLKKENKKNQVEIDV